MSEILAPTVFTRRGDTTHDDPGEQAHRIAASVWQTLVYERQQHMPVRTADVWSSSVSLTHPDKDHIDTLQAFRHAWAHGTLASHRVRWVEFIAEPAETSKDIEALRESFRKLRESLAETGKGIFVAFTRATSETSTLVSWCPAVPHGIIVPALSEREWTETKNQRRCDLVDKDIDGTISVAEKVELDQLQAEMLTYRRKVAPLPLEDLRKLHQELLQQASDQTTH